jgi:hypothetical protein
MGTVQVRQPIATHRHFQSPMQFCCMQHTPQPCVGDDHLSEIAEILAAGLTRLLARKSSQESCDFGESSLALSEHQSGHAHPTEVEKQT